MNIIHASLYTESPELSEQARREYARSIEALAHSGFSSYEIDPSAAPLAKALGAPLDRIITEKPSLSQEYVAADDICEIFRLRITALPQLPFYGLMFIPKNAKGSLPLCIAAHGHLGTPELMYGMHGKNGYSGIIHRLISKGFAVFAPQFLIWNYGFSPAKPHYSTTYDRLLLDEKLKKLGGGIIALEIFCLIKSIDALSSVRALDVANLSVCGMSYGAFYTMRAMALDRRIQRGYFMSCFDGGLDERFPEWRFRSGFEPMRDGEIAALCSPRPIYIEVGRYDDIFPPEGAQRETQTAYRTYKADGAKDSFNFHIWNGAHLVNPDSPGIDFLMTKGL